MTIREIVESKKYDYNMTAREFYIAWHNAPAFTKERLALSNYVAESLMKSTMSGTEMFSVLYPAMIAIAKSKGLI